MRRLLTLVCCAAGCGQGPDDLFVLSGRTTSTSGEPLDGVAVSLAREFSVLCDYSKPIKHQLTADGGLFSFDLVRVEIKQLGQSSSGCLRARADFDSGTSAWNDIYNLPMHHELPELRDWRPSLSLDDAGVAHFQPIVPEPPPTSGICGRFVHGLVARVDGGVIWEQPDHVRVHGDAGYFVYSTVSPLVLAPEALEDQEAVVTMEAKRFTCDAWVQEGVTSTLSFVSDTRWTTAEKLTLRGHRAPVSRGASCSPWPDPCPFTDGRAAPIRFEETTITLELTAAASVRSVVLRNAQASPGPRPFTLTVRSGANEVRVEVNPMPVPVEDEQARIPRVYWKVDLPRELPPSTHFEVELDRLSALGELSLFD